VRLISSVCEGSGSKNEDACGFIGAVDDVQAAWVKDGVTVINERSYLDPAEKLTDAQWIVEKTQGYLLVHAGLDISMQQLHHGLVDHVIAEFARAQLMINVPEDYDPPATCLILAKRYGSNWHVLRLGDSAYIAEGVDGTVHEAMSPATYSENYITREAAKRRAAGMLDLDQLLQEFRPAMMESRAKRNTPGSYSVVEAAEKAKHFATITELGPLQRILICSDGFYRAVDTYGLYPHNGFLDACRDVAPVLKQLRAVEAADPLCLKFPRFKVADDATALYLEL
jgi:Protein phosphatase 2C